MCGKSSRSRISWQVDGKLFGGATLTKPWQMRPILRNLIPGPRPNSIFHGRLRLWLTPPPLLLLFCGIKHTDTSKKNQKIKSKKFLQRLDFSSSSTSNPMPSISVHHIKMSKFNFPRETLVNPTPPRPFVVLATKHTNQRGSDGVGIRPHLCWRRLIILTAATSFS